MAVLLLLAVSSSAAADTIVLKNGRRIVAENVTEDATHVTYQTSAGQLTIPKSIVARIEHDNFTLLVLVEGIVRAACVRARSRTGPRV